MPMQRNLVRLRVRDDAIYLSRGDTVLAVDRDGFLDGAPERGLFVHRTRLLSRYRCRLGRRKPFPVTESCVEQHRWLANNPQRSTSRQHQTRRSILCSGCRSA